MAEIFEFEARGRDGERLATKGSCRSIVHAFECAQWWAEGLGVPDGATIGVRGVDSGSSLVGRFRSMVLRELQLAGFGSGRNG